jgi:hypothetical protein
MDLAWVPFYLSGFIRFEAAGVVNMLLLLENLILRFCKYQTTKSIRVRMLIYNAGPGPVISPESLSTGDVAAPKSHLFANLPICAFVGGSKRNHLRVGNATVVSLIGLTIAPRSFTVHQLGFLSVAYLQFTSTLQNIHPFSKPCTSHA